MRLQPGRAAPDFAVRDMLDRPVELAAYRGQKLLLSFFRYAGCPLCQLRIGQLLGRFPAWRDQGLQVLAVFQSSAAVLRESAAEQVIPFPLIPDPERNLYRQYGLEHSWWGLIRGLLSWQFVQSLRGSGWRGRRREGSATQLPADFLIGPDQRIQLAYYGTAIGDHVPLPQIAGWLDGEQPAGG